MSTEDRNIRDFNEARIKQEASDWVAKHDCGLSAEEQDAFFEWLAENPAHSEAYSRRQIVWKEMNVLADWRPEHSEEPNPDLLAVSPAKSKVAWYWAVAGFAALLAVGLFIGSNLRQSNQSDRILLASGESAQFYEYHVLEDGSKVELNRGAQALVRFTEDKRLIDLLAGEAHFTVAKDKKRPFVVRARGAVVQAIGTAFNVAMDTEAVEVIVTEGRVLLNPSIATTHESLIDETEPLVSQLSAGQRSVVDLDADLVAPIVEEIAIAEIETRLAWRDEQLDFTEMALSEVALEFNRRNHTQLVIGDLELNDLPVSGAFSSNNLDLFVEALGLYGVNVEYDGTSKIVLRK